jgi:hypothetical protein
MIVRTAIRLRIDTPKSVGGKIEARVKRAAHRDHESVLHGAPDINQFAQS